MKLLNNRYLIKHLQDVRQTRQYADFMIKIGWQVIKINNQCQLFYRRLPIIPIYIGKVLRCHWPIKINKLKKIIQKYKIVFVKIQFFETVNINFNLKSIKLDSHPLIPTKTIYINLTKPLFRLKKGLKQKTRYNLNLSKKKKLITKIISGNKISKKRLDDFFYLWSKNKPFNLIFKPSYKELTYLIKSFTNKCFFVLAFHAAEQQMIAGALILNSKNMAFYWHNCSNNKGKKLFAPTLCVWEAIKESKNRGLKIFDFEGIWDKRYPRLNQGWQGFTKFKNGFGQAQIKFTKPFILKNKLF